MWKWDICETQNDDGQLFCYICNAEKPTAPLIKPEPVPAPPPVEEAAEERGLPAYLDDGSPIPEGRPPIANTSVAAMDEPASAITGPAPDGFLPSDGGSVFEWETPPIDKPAPAAPAPRVHEDWERETPLVVKPRPAPTDMHRPEALRPAAEKPKKAAPSKKRYAARMAIRGALIAANIGLIIWNVVNITSVLM